MDIREKKTKRSIYNAFLELRSRKQLEKITVKELAEAAEISKATFYLHYKDIYDLSEQLQSEVLKNVIDILFSGSQEAVLPINTEKVHFRGASRAQGRCSDQHVSYVPHYGRILRLSP